MHFIKYLQWFNIGQSLDIVISICKTINGYHSVVSVHISKETCILLETPFHAEFNALCPTLYIKVSVSYDHIPYIHNCLLFVVKRFCCFTTLPSFLKNLHSYQLLQAFIVLTCKSLPKNFHSCKVHVIKLRKTWNFFTTNNKQYMVITWIHVILLAIRMHTKLFYCFSCYLAL